VGREWHVPSGALFVALDDPGAAALGIDREELLKVPTKVRLFGTRADDGVELWSVRELSARPVPRPSAAGRSCGAEGG
jgi:hypothetical protein